LSLNPTQATLASIFVWIDGILVASLSHTTHYSQKKPEKPKKLENHKNDQNTPI